MSMLHHVVQSCMYNHRDSILESIVSYQVFLPEILALLHDLLFYAVRTKNTNLQASILRLNDYFQVIHPKMIDRIKNDPYKAQQFISNVRARFLSGVINAEWLEKQVTLKWMPAFLCLCSVFYQLPRAEWTGVATQCTTHFQDMIPAICVYFRHPDAATVPTTEYDHIQTMSLVLGKTQPDEKIYDCLMLNYEDDKSEYEVAQQEEAEGSSSSSSSSSSSPLDAHSSGS